MKPVLLMADTMTNKGYLEIANSPMMWAMVIPTVIMVCIQAYVFIRDAVKAGPIVGLTKEDTREAMRAGAICSIGPGLSMFTVMIALMSILGGAIRLVKTFYHWNNYNRNVGCHRRGNRNGC